MLFKKFRKRNKVIRVLRLAHMPIKVKCKVTDVEVDLFSAPSGGSGTPYINLSEESSLKQMAMDGIISKHVWTFNHCMIKLCLEGNIKARKINATNYHKALSKFLEDNHCLLLKSDCPKLIEESTKVDISYLINHAYHIVSGEYKF